MPTLIKKIEKSESSVSKMETLWKKMQQDFLADDGIIDPKEKKKLKKIRDKIKLADAKIFDFRKQYEDNKAVWLGHSGAFEEIKIQTIELEEWGDTIAKALKTDVVAIEGFEENQEWKKATETLKSAEAKAKKPTEERARQLMFKVDYEQLDADVQKIYSAIQTSDFVNATDVAELFIKADDNILAADKHAQAQSYDKACDEGAKIFAKLDLVQQAITQHEIHYETFVDTRQIMSDRLDKISNREYTSETVAGAVTSIETNLPAIDSAAESFDYVHALDLLEVTFEILSEAEKDIAENDPAEQLTHKVTLPDKTVLLLTKAEYDERVAELCKQLERGPLSKMRTAVEILADKWQHYYKMNDDQLIVSFIVETVAGADLPPKSIVTNAQDALKKCKSAVSSKDLEAFRKSCGAAEKAITDGMKKMKEYQKDIEGAADITITALEFTATASFTFCSVFAAPVVASVAGTGVVASAVIGGAAVAATQSTATEIGHWGAGGFDASWEGTKESVSNVLIDTGVGGLTGLISKGGGGGKHVVEAIAVKIAPKIATETGFKLLSTAAAKKVTVYLVTEGCKQATEDAIKNVGAMIKGDPKLTKEKFFDDLASSWVKGAALAPLGHVIDKFAGDAYKHLDPKDRSKIEDVVAKGVSKRLTDDIHIDTFNNMIKDNTDELVKKYVGDMMKKNSEKAIEESLEGIKGTLAPATVEKSIVESLLNSPEYDAAIEQTINALVKEVETSTVSRQP